MTWARAPLRRRATSLKRSESFPVLSRITAKISPCSGKHALLCHSFPRPDLAPYSPDGTPGCLRCPTALLDRPKFFGHAFVLHVFPTVIRSHHDRISDGASCLWPGRDAGSAGRKGHNAGSEAKAASASSALPTATTSCPRLAMSRCRLRRLPG